MTRVNRFFISVGFVLFGAFAILALLVGCGESGEQSKETEYRLDWIHERVTRLEFLGNPTSQYLRCVVACGRSYGLFDESGDWDQRGQDQCESFCEIMVEQEQEMWDAISERVDEAASKVRPKE